MTAVTKPLPDLRASAYLRMSSDKQDLSLSTQLEAIRSYAFKNGLTLIKIYQDAAKSGLRIENRDGMKELLRDVLEVPPPFEVVLVYDVSRWGRFQDIDAAAYYEYTCRMNGVRVVYVQEPFGSDIDPLTALLKTLKRAMAAEYARELGVKTRAGQDRAIQLGFQMGSLPPLGLRRVAIDRWGNRRPLAPFQRKGLQNERIAWVLGPESEVKLVNRIFELYAAEGGTIKKTARTLQEEGVLTPSGNQFRAPVVDRLLRCEAFAGNFVWGRVHQAAGKAIRKRPATRAEGVIERVVQKELWDQVQRKLWERRRQHPDKEELLEILRAKLAQDPNVSTLDLEAIGIRSRKAYTNAFGSVAKALELAGRDSRAARSLHEKRKVVGRNVGNRLSHDIAALIASEGIACHIHTRSRVLIIESRCRLRLQLTWPRSALLIKRWQFPKKSRFPAADWVLLAQMQEDKTALQFFLFTMEECRNAPSWLGEAPPPPLIALRSASELKCAIIAAAQRNTHSQVD
ncbi:recombinase family protein [Ottowia thiooxydans]|uniref:recombinase family protein n=1 Tax=Ottowia thiooxydans TaxID=219182 RepID=UPI00040C975D|nr:recombinase family protein [Ottowia thiooxydans]